MSKAELYQSVLPKFALHIKYIYTTSGCNMLRHKQVLNHGALLKFIQLHSTNSTFNLNIN